MFIADKEILQQPKQTRDFDLGSNQPEVSHKGWVYWLQMSLGTLALSIFIFTSLSVEVPHCYLITIISLLNIQALRLCSRQKEGEEQEAKEQRMKRPLPARLHRFVQKGDRSPGASVLSHWLEPGYMATLNCKRG